MSIMAIIFGAWCFIYILTRPRKTRDERGIGSKKSRQAMWDRGELSPLDNDEP